MVVLHLGLTFPREFTMQHARVNRWGQIRPSRAFPLLCAIIDVDRTELAHDGLGHLNFRVITRIYSDD